MSFNENVFKISRIGFRITSGCSAISGRDSQVPRPKKNIRIEFSDVKWAIAETETYFGANTMKIKLDTDQTIKTVFSN